MPEVELDLVKRMNTETIEIRMDQLRKTEKKLKEDRFLSPQPNRKNILSIDADDILSPPASNTTNRTKL